VLVVLIPQPSLAQWTIFRIVIALGGAGYALALVGALSISLKPHPRATITASGSLAALCTLYFFDPARGALDIGTPSTGGSPSRFKRGQDIPAIGGTGGAPFNADCPGGSLAVGVSATLGSAVSNLRFLCGRPTGNFDALSSDDEVQVSPSDPSPTIGHLITGTSANAECPENTFAIGIGVELETLANYESPVVRTLSLECAPPIYKGRRMWNVVPDYTRATIITLTGVQGAVPVRCTQAGWVRGALGRSGTLVDAIGVHCAALGIGPRD
jgi:hypothetical protein